jgi:hypothetical protein
MQVADSPRPQRRGVPRSFSLDYDAVVLLKALCPNSRGQGMFMSELIRKEAHARTARPQMLAELAAQTRD